MTQSNEPATMTFDVEIVLRERDYAVTDSSPCRSGPARAGRLDGRGRRAAARRRSCWRSTARKNPQSEQRYVALRGFSWIVEPTCRRRGHRDRDPDGRRGRRPLRGRAGGAGSHDSPGDRCRRAAQAGRPLIAVLSARLRKRAVARRPRHESCGFPRENRASRTAPALPCMAGDDRSRSRAAHEATVSDPRSRRRRTCPVGPRGTAARRRVPRDRRGDLRRGQAAARGSSFDLLITDVRLRGFNGLNLVMKCRRRLSRHGRHHHQRLRRAADGARSEPVSGDVRRQADPARGVPRRRSLDASPSVRRQRRWPRKRVIGGFRVTAAGKPAAVVDVSYGGLRLEVPKGHATWRSRSPWSWPASACSSRWSRCGRARRTTATTRCAAPPSPDDQSAAATRGARSSIGCQPER